MKEKKICIVASSGGHLSQLFILKPFWEKYNRFWVTFRKQDAISLLKNEKVYWAYFPTNRNLINLIKNTIIATKILFKEKPNIIISNGAGVAIPFFYLGKIINSRLVYIEVYDRISSPTLTGKIVYPLSDVFVLQWKEQKKFYPKGQYLGEIL